MSFSAVVMVEMIWIHALVDTKMKTSLKVANKKKFEKTDFSSETKRLLNELR